MKTSEAIKLGIDMSAMVCTPYVDDLSDADLMRRPHSKCNHIKWQLGHLIASEHNMINTAFPGSMPALPAGFAERYTKETATSDDPTKFDSKEVLMKTYQQQRSAFLKALEKLQDADFEKPSPESFQSYAPTIGSLCSMIGSHWLMHAGQWVIVRRELGKEPLF